MRCIFLLPVVFLCACGQVPKHFAPASTAVVHSRITDIKGYTETARGEAGSAKKEIAKAREIGKENKNLVLALNAADQHIDRLTAELLKTTQAATEADTKLTEADKLNQVMADRANKLQAKYEIMAKKYARLKWPLIFILTAAIGFLVWKFKVPLLALGWLGIGIMIASPLAVFAFLSWFL